MDNRYLLEIESNEFQLKHNSVSKEEGGGGGGEGSEEKSSIGSLRQRIVDKVSGMTSQTSLGEIKLKFQYTEEKIYNLPIYLGLQGCLMEKGISLIKFIYKILKKQDITTMGSSLIKIFDANMDTLRFIQ